MEIGRCLVNYAATEISRIMGHQSADIENILGYADSEYVAHRSHIAFFPQDSRPVSPVLKDSRPVSPTIKNSRPISPLMMQTA